MTRATYSLHSDITAVDQCAITLFVLFAWAWPLVEFRSYQFTDNFIVLLIVKEIIGRAIIHCSQQKHAKSHVQRAQNHVLWLELVAFLYHSATVVVYVTRFPFSNGLPSLSVMYYAMTGALHVVMRVFCLSIGECNVRTLDV